LFLLLGVPDLDVAWEHQPPHFWLVLVSALLSFLLGFLMAEAAARRGDARVLLVALAFLAGSGFLALHALATPGVLLAGKSAGFQIASAIGLDRRRLRRGLGAPLERRAQAVTAGTPAPARLLGVALAVWAVLALGKLPPLDEAITPEAARGPLLALWAVGMVLYGYAAFRYARLYARRRAAVALAVASAWVLLAGRCSPSPCPQLARQLVWHLLMLLAFASSRRRLGREWKRGSGAEVFADLYEERTLGRRGAERPLRRPAGLHGLLRADAAGRVRECSTPTSRPPRRSSGRGGGGRQTVGDASSPSSAAHVRARAAGRGCASRRPARRSRDGGRLARFRVGVNSAKPSSGSSRRRARARSRPQATSSPGLAAGSRRAPARWSSPAGRAALGEVAVVEDLGELPVKGKELPVRAFVLGALPTRGNERNERLQDQDREGDG
jgi:hypothetical protein